MNDLIEFEDKSIRKTLYNSESYFSVLDVLTNTSNPTDYFKKLRKGTNNLKCS